MKRGRLNRFCKIEEVPAYARLAKVYDRMMDHVDYTAWADYIIKLFKKYGKGIRRVVDGGCGTGSLAAVLEKRGYRVVGFDRSREMIRMARRKSRSSFWQGDLVAIPLSKEWDAFLCLYDTIQYLRIEEMERLFDGLRGVLVDGGLLIFDAVTESHVLRYWASYDEKDCGEGWESMRKSWFDRKAKCQHTLFEIFFRHDRKVYCEHHSQRIYTLEELNRTTVRSGFEVLGLFDGFTLKPGNESSDRVHFVLRQEDQ
jgi:SAM-dependent methyltransferase